MGPNVYHSNPVILTTVDLEEWTDVESNHIPNFVDNLLSFLPGLKLHHCSRGHENGFVERLNEGTFLAHIIEHVALELSSLAGIEVSYGKTRYAGKPGHYEIATRFKNADGMKACLNKSVELVEAAATSKDFDVVTAVNQICAIVNETKLGPSAQAILDAAKKRKIPFLQMGTDSLIRLGYGKKLKRVQTAISEHTSLLASDIAQDKYWTKQVLQESFIPVPEGFVVSSLGELKSKFSEISHPVVIKPFNGNHGNGVVLNIQSIEEAENAFQLAKTFSEKVIVEEMCDGQDYRVLIVDGKLVAAAHRIPPSVIGDGESTISQLIDVLNMDPRRGQGHDNILTKIEVDDCMKEHLRQQCLSFDSILLKGQEVFLRKNANISSGGHAVDVTEIVHPEIKTLCERAARVIGLDICGIDLIHHNITRPVDDKVKIIEVNAGPGLRMHLFPSEGKSHPVGESIINMLYPNFDQGRIPIVSVTGTNGKTTVVRLLHKIFSDNPERHVGLTTTDGIWIGNEKIFSGDTTGPKSSQLILSDPKVDMAILEVARGGLLRGGLAYDWSDVSVVTNIRPDHIGQDGIEDLEDLVWIKSVVAERVKEGGILVLNADDETTLNLRDREGVKKVNKHICLFSVDPQNPNLRAHKISGGSACWIENGWIYVQHGIIFDKVIQVSEVPLTLNGVADFQVSNVLAAISAAVASGATINQIAKGLKSFHPLQENMGRLNLYKVHDGYVILDYGHNADALTAIGRMLGQFDGYSKTAVFGMPGDRSDELLLKGGESIAYCFNKFILKDDDDLRGRQKTEVPKLVRSAILKKNPKAKIEIIDDQKAAIHSALQDIKQNEIVAIFYEKLSAVMSVLLQYDPQPVDLIPQLELDDIQAELTRKEQEHARTL